MIEELVMHIDLAEPLSEGEWIRGIMEPFLASPAVNEFTLATFIWVSLAIAFYIYSESIVIPMVLTIIYGGLVIPLLPGTIAGMVVPITLIVLGGLLVAIIWRLRRG